jgi:mono/diheme cytochrome c family protein
MLFPVVLVLPCLSEARGDVARGEYLTTILGCGGCHTEGALLGRQTGPWLAGSRVGVAWSNPESGDHPAIVFPANLTPDRATGLGAWSEREIARAIRTGMGHSHEMLIPVMPWPNYSLLDRDDARAIAAYLKSLPPVERKIPQNVVEGVPSRDAYLRIGVFLFDPEQAAPPEEPVTP